MNGGADEFARNVAWQLRVGVERDHVTNTFQQRIVGSADEETRVARTAQQSIELFELATLSFPPHPTVLARIPLPPPVEEMKTIVAMTAIECVDAALRDREEV